MSSSEMRPSNMGVKLRFRLEVEMAVTKTSYRRVANKQTNISNLRGTNRVLDFGQES